MFEFTVFPNRNDYNPSNIIEKMEQATGKSFSRKADRPGLRGTVRILTNATKDRYIYTFDHYASFFGPWKLGQSLKTESTRFSNNTFTSRKSY